MKSQFCRLESISELVPEDKVHYVSKCRGIFFSSNKYEYFQVSKMSTIDLPTGSEIHTEPKQARKSTYTARFITTFETVAAQTANFLRLLRFRLVRNDPNIITYNYKCK